MKFSEKIILIISLSFISLSIILIYVKFSIEKKEITTLSEQRWKELNKPPCDDCP